VCWLSPAPLFLFRNQNPFACLTLGSSQIESFSCVRNYVVPLCLAFISIPPPLLVSSAQKASSLFQPRFYFMQLLVSQPLFCYSYAVHKVLSSQGRVAAPLFPVDLCFSVLEHLRFRLATPPPPYIFRSCFLQPSSLRCFFPRLVCMPHFQSV